MRNSVHTNDYELSAVSIGFILLAFAIIARLFVLQVLEHNYYSTFALSTHEIYEKLYPKRGSIYFRDSRSDAEYAVAVNKEFYQLFVVPSEIPATDVGRVTDKLAEILKFDSVQKDDLAKKVGKGDDPYEPVARKVEEKIWLTAAAEKLPGVYSVGELSRFYPEDGLGGNLLGFCGLDDAGLPIGSYGVEGYWDKTLAGKGGFSAGEKGAKGGWIALAGRTLVPAENGADIILTIDRSLQYQACERLRQGFEGYGAKSASLVLMEPKTGAILAMCSYPDFDPNNYSKVSDPRVYNNTNIFTPYEPGSVFKPITMAMALDLDLVAPSTVFTDPCSRKIDDREIHNALNKCYGQATMTQVLENSINTGMVWVAEKIGKERFASYVNKFGFGEKTGIAANTEIEGNVSSLEKKGMIYLANGSFGQGLTVTPLQLATAYSALANGGQLPKPYLVKEVRYENGKREKFEPQTTGVVISSRAAKLLTGMLVSVVEKGGGKPARLPGYYIAGKTGTAQIPGKGGYTDETNHTFTGFFPANDPKFVLVVKYEAPARAWAESTAAPVFRDVADFALKYYAIPEDR